MASNKVEIFDPAVILAFLFGAISDVSFIFMIGLVIPGIGLAIAGFVILAHYGCGMIAIGFFWGKTKGWLAKLMLIVAVVIPLPIISVGIALAIFMTNSALASFIVEQVLIQAVAVATAGAGEALEGVALAGETAELTAEGVEAASTVAEAGEGVAEAGEAAKDVEEGAEDLKDARDKVKKVTDQLDKTNQGQDDDQDQEQGAGGNRTPQIEPEALGQQRELLGDEGQLQKELLQETPQANWPQAIDDADQSIKKIKASAQKPKKNNGKVYDISSNPTYQRNQDKEAEQERKDLAA